MINFFKNLFRKKTVKIEIPRKDYHLYIISNNDKILVDSFETSEDAELYILAFPFAEKYSLEKKCHYGCEVIF